MAKKILTVLIWGTVIAGIGAAQTVVPGGNVSGNWEVAGSPYLVEGEITVPGGETLTIEPGVEVIFQGHYKFIVRGLLEAVGTAADSILFTAADTSEGWHSISFINAPDSSRLSYCIIQYGKANIGSYEDLHGGGIYCSNSNPILSHSTIHQNNAYWNGGGIYCYGSCPTISFCDIRGNSASSGGGIYLLTNSDAIITDCIVADNSIPDW